MTSYVFIVEPGDEGRIDSFLVAQFPESTRARITELFATGDVRLEGKKVKKGARVSEGQQVKVARGPATDEDFRPLPQEGPLDILYRDDEIIVLNKPAGIPCYPLRVQEEGTLANRLVHHFPECIQVGKDPREAGMAHRLDTYTTGLLLAARTQTAWQALRSEFSQGKVQKEYLAVVHDRPVSAECEEPILQSGNRVVIDYAGLDAHTSWTEISRSDSFALLRCIAHTGRMHQVRAHLALCGSPIVGDALYGGTPQDGLKGHFLHASTLRIQHPSTGESMEFVAPLPAERRDWLQAHDLQL